MDSFLRDLKHSLRMFRQSSGFTAAAVAALALGIGSNTAIFSVVNTVLLKPPPFPDAERIVLFLNTSPQGSGTGASPTKFNHWRAQSAVVHDVSAYRTGVVNWTGGETPEQLHSAQVSIDFFRLFGAPVILGRTFNSAEDAPKGPKSAVISERLWERRFSRDSKIIGNSIQLGGDPHEIVGIIGAAFDFQDLGDIPDVYTAFQIDPNSADQGHYFGAAGRLNNGVTVDQARAALNVSAEAFKQKYPGSLGDNGSFGADSLRDALAANVRQALYILLGAVAMVLLIACANVANLLLARAVARKREIAIRASIGAGRWRIVRQLLTESLLLAFAGAILGSFIGIAGIRALLSINTAQLPRVGENGAMVTLDWRVLLFTFGITLFTSVLFGLIPAWQASRADLSATLKESGSRSGSGFRQNKMRTILVVSELALAVVLLVGAALLIRTSVNINSVNPGYSVDNVITMRTSLAGKRFVKSASVEQLVRDGTERLRALPGVDVATAACCIPLEGGYGLPFRVMGRALENGPFHGGGGWLPISPGYFDAFKIPVVKGRAFNERDDNAGAPVVMINQTMAKRFWPNGDPLNDRILIGKGVMPALADEQPRQIIGIVGDVRDGALNRDPNPTMYLPSGQITDGINELNVALTPMRWIVRTKSDPASLSPAIQGQIRQVSGLPVSNISTMRDVVSRSTSRQRFNMLLMSVFAAAALALAAIGVYGLMSYSVQQRTQEIGIRLALGAQTVDVRRMVILQGMKFALVGVAVGTAVAFGLAKQIAAFLFRVEANDPMVFASIPLLLGCTAFLAVWLPALRATRVDPVTALRYE